MHTSLKNHVWTVVRKPVLLYGIVSLSIALAVYGLLLTRIKSNVLHDRLGVANITIASSVEAGDWDLALTNLRANAQAGQLYGLRVLSQDGKVNLIGPLGTRERGLGSYCAEDLSTPHFRLSGCIRIFGNAELYSVLIFIALSTLTLGLSFVFFRRTSLQLFDRIAQMLTEENLAGSSGIQEIEQIRSRLRLLLQEVEQNSKNQIFAQLAAQVAHDIRSPLAVLKMVLDLSKELPDDQKQLVRTAATRIQDIAANLSMKNREKAKHGAAEPVASIVESIIAETTAFVSSETSIQFVRDYAPNVHTYFAMFQPREFGAIISNLLNNSTEALPNGGIIRVRVFARETNIVIEIIDNGMGISDEILPQIGQCGATFGKVNGSGLGIFNARSKIETWGGKFEIESTIGVGTTVRLALPLIEAPKWLAVSIDLEGKDGVVVIDDDALIRNLWRQRFESSFPFDGGVECLKNPHEAMGWAQENHTAISRRFFLVDLDFPGYKINGLDIIRESGMAENAILVTGRYDDEEIIGACEKMGVRLYPKPLLGFIPILNAGKQIACQ